jgi:hypothetical protein
VEDERVWETLRARQFAYGNHAMALRDRHKSGVEGNETCGTYIGIQHARLLGCRLNVRHRRLEDKVLVQSPVESLKVEIDSVLLGSRSLVPGRKPFLAIAEAGSENCHSQRSFSSAIPRRHTQQVRKEYRINTYIDSPHARPAVY